MLRLVDTYHAQIRVTWSMHYNYSPTRLLGLDHAVRSDWTRCAARINYKCAVNQLDFFVTNMIRRKLSLLEHLRSILKLVL